MRIALAQINPTVGDLDGNRKKIAEYIERAKSFAADIVVFPELAICGYPPEDLLYKEHFVKQNLMVLKALKERTRAITAVIGFVDMDKQKNLYNAAAVIQKDVNVIGVKLRHGKVGGTVIIDIRDGQPTRAGTQGADRVIRGHGRIRKGV